MRRASWIVVRFECAGHGFDDERGEQLFALHAGLLHKVDDPIGSAVRCGLEMTSTLVDAQLNWDPYATLSGWFGVTSVSIGQCGFGFAPTRPEDRDLPLPHAGLR